MQCLDTGCYLKKSIEHTLKFHNFSIMYKTPCMTQHLLSVFNLLPTCLTPIRPILITLLQVIMQLLPITNTYVLSLI